MFGLMWTWRGLSDNWDRVVLVYLRDMRREMCIFRGYAYLTV